MDAKPPRAGRCVCSDGTGRDGYIVREQACLSGRHTVVDPDSMWLFDLRGNPATNAPKAAAGKAKQGQRQHAPRPPSQDVQHRRGRRPCTARRTCRKSWVPMGGAPRKVMSTPRSEGPPAPKPRPPSASVRVELERAIWMGANLGTPSGGSSETQPVAKQIRAPSAMPRSQHLWRPQSAGCPGRSFRIPQERRLENGMQEVVSNFGSSSCDVHAPPDLKPDASRTAEADERKKHEIETMMQRLEFRDRLAGSGIGNSNCSSETSQATSPRRQRPISAPACGMRKNPAAVAWGVRRVPDYDPCL